MFNTIWTKIKAWASAVWTASWTKLWAGLQAIPAMLLFVVSEVNGYITDPHFQSILSTIDFPKWATLGIAVFGLITYLAHGRSED